MNNEATDDTLVQAALDGDEEAAHLLSIRYDSYLARLITWFLVTKRCASPNDHAQVVKSETQLSAWNNLDRLEHLEAYRSWLTTIAINKARQHLRRCHRDLSRFTTIETEDDYELPEAQIYTDSQTIEGAIYVDEVLRLAEQISPDFAAILRLHVLADQDLPEIAQILDMPYVEVRNTFYRKRKLLDAQLRLQESANKARRRHEVTQPEPDSAKAEKPGKKGQSDRIQNPLQS